MIYTFPHKICKLATHATRCKDMIRPISPTKMSFNGHCAKAHNYKVCEQSPFRKIRTKMEYSVHWNSPTLCWVSVQCLAVGHTYKLQIGRTCFCLDRRAHWPSKTSGATLSQDAVSQRGDVGCQNFQPPASAHSAAGGEHDP